MVEDHLLPLNDTLGLLEQQSRLFAHLQEQFALRVLAVFMGRGVAASHGDALVSQASVDRAFALIFYSLILLGRIRAIIDQVLV